MVHLLKAVKLRIVNVKKEIVKFRLFTSSRNKLKLREKNENGVEEEELNKHYKFHDLDFEENDDKFLTLTDLMPVFNLSKKKKNSLG